MKKYLTTSTCTLLLIALLNVATMLHFQEAKALSVEGVITEDTVWTFENSPYEITDAVTVATGAKLTIEPGVKVEFGTGSSLLVNGSLYAVGTSMNQISFTSNRNEPVAGDWDGITFRGDESSTFAMSFCIVEYAIDGVNISSLGKAEVENSTVSENLLSGIHAFGPTNLHVRQNTIQLNTHGISASGVTTSGLEIVGNHILDNEDGVHLSVYGDRSRISNVTISYNAFELNTHGIYLHSHGMSTTEPTKANAYINRVKIIGNLMESNKYGMYLLAEAWGEPGLLGGGAYIYSSTVYNNLISLSEYAVYIDSTSNWYSWISTLNISRNTIHSSDNGIFLHAFRTPQPPYSDLPFDAILVDNTVSANGKGIRISGDVRANFTGNSISYNSHGIHLSSAAPSENVARNNDIYRNTEYGVYVAVEASINAERNYWGDSSGPFHETLNPFGEGDRVYGDGENLVLTPFMVEPFGEINDAPFAVLEVLEIEVLVNQSISFDATKSTDDESIAKYFFDAGDGTTIQVFHGIARHTYASPGVYNVSLVVTDNFGVNSTNIAIETITVSLPPLVVSVFLNPPSVFSQGNVTVEIYVSDGETSVAEVVIQLSSDLGGDFEPSSGYTDSDGYFESTFFAPDVSESMNVRITAAASKENYEEDSDEAYLSVLVPSGGIGFEFHLIWYVAVIVLIAFAAFVLLRRKRKRDLSRSFRSPRTKKRG